MLAVLGFVDQSEELVIAAKIRLPAIVSKYLPDMIKPTVIATTLPSGDLAAGDRALAAHDYDRAVLTFQEILSRAPETALAHRGLGLALVGAGSVEAAQDALQRYLSLRPNAADAAQIRRHLLVNSSPSKARSPRRTGKKASGKRKPAGRRGR